MRSTVGAVEPRRGCDGITSVPLSDRSACIAASLKLDSSYKACCRQWLCGKVLQACFFQCVTRQSSAQFFVIMLKLIIKADYDSVR